MNSKKVLNNIKEILLNSYMLDDETYELFDKLKSFKIEKQVELFDQFVKNVDNYYNYILSSMDNTNNVCDTKSHIYSSWYEKYSFDNYNGSSFKNRFWCKKCLKCGHEEITYIKPKEISILEESKENKKAVLTRVKSK